VEYKDYYKILGVPKTASEAEIKKAFRKLAREHHPDRNPGDKAAEKRFKDVNEAHAVLSDKEKRTRYDMLGPDFANVGDAYGGANPFAGFTGGRAGSGTGPGGIRWEFRTTGSPGAGDASGFSDFFRMLFGEAAAPAGTRAQTARRAETQTGDGSFEDILSQLGYEQAGGRTSTRRPVAQDAEATAELTLEEAFHGTTRVVEFEGRRYEVSIPRGVDTGSRVKLSGKGPGGRDLVVTVKLKPHRNFTRKGADLERELPLTLEEALLGAEIPVSTLKGRVLLTIPAGTQNGKTFRLAGQGMPRLRSGGAGDLYVRTRVVLPSNLDHEAREAGKRFLRLVQQPDPRTETRS
jgi:curved DNA-binding protein